jgi:hypothetical protein
VLSALWNTTLSHEGTRFISHVIIIANRLLVVLLSVVVDDVEEAELVDTLGGGNDAEPITELLLLEKLLCAVPIISVIFRQWLSSVVVDIQVLQVAARELLVRDDLDLSIALLGDGDGLAEVSGAALDLDAIVKELLERLDVEDLVVDGLRAVDDELCRLSAPASQIVSQGLDRFSYLLGDLLSLLGASGGFLLHVQVP